MSSRIARRVVAALAAWALLALACSSDQDRLARHLESAKAFSEKGQSKEALLELRNALQLDPKSADVNFRIAAIMEQDGKFGDAAFFYRETTRLDPSRTDAALAEAKLVIFDDTARAEELIDRVLEADPSNAMAYVRRSEIALARGDADGALDAGLTATELDPKEPMTHMQLGIVHMARVRQHRLRGETPADDIYRSAAAELGKADELFGGGMAARAELGRLYASWPGHEADAEAAFRSAVAVAAEGEPRGRAAGATMSYARAVGNEELLLWALEQMVQSAPGNLPAWDELAFYAERKQAGSGDSVYKRLLETRPQDVDAHVRFARFMASSNRFDEAIAHLEAQVSGGANPAVALEEISSLRLSRGDLEPARAAIQRLEQEYPGHARTALARGRLALAEQRVDEAAEALRTYVGSEDSVEGQRLLAIAELRRQNYPAAAAAIDAAIQRETTSATAELLRIKANIYQASGDWPQVLVTLQRLSQQSPTLPTDQLLAARAFYETNRGAAGKQVLEQLLATETPPIGAYLEYATRERRSDPVKARGYLEKVLAQAPRHEGALRILVTEALEAGKPDQALALLDGAAAAGPLPPGLLLLRAQVHASKQDYGKAEEDARRAFAAAPTLTPALDLLARIYSAQNRLEEAIASFQEADEVGALPPSGQVLLGRLQLAAGRADEARASYEKALAGRPDLPGAKNDLAWLLASQGADLERALTLAQEAQQAEPENAEFVDTLGYVFLRKGLHDAAVQQFRFAIELSERSGDPRPGFSYHLGLALRALGRQQEAAEALEKALALDAAFPEADDARRELEATKAAAAAPAPG